MQLRRLIALLVVLTVPLGETASARPHARPSAASQRPPPRGPDVFRFGGVSGGLGTSLAIDAKGRWERSSHSGSSQHGRLSRRARLRFMSALAAAPFKVSAAPCPPPTVPVDRLDQSEGHYSDLVRRRHVTASFRHDRDRGWIPCGTAVDDATRQLPLCLESLIHRDGSACSP